MVGSQLLLGTSRYPTNRKRVKYPLWFPPMIPSYQHELRKLGMPRVPLPGERLRTMDPGPVLSHMVLDH